MPSESRFLGDGVLKEKIAVTACFVDWAVMPRLIGYDAGRRASNPIHRFLTLDIIPL
jgi:hypothetical protein